MTTTTSEGTGRIPEDSPISDASMEVIAKRVSRRFKQVRRRMPKEVRVRALSVLDRVYKMAQAAPSDEPWPVTRRKRIELARALEELAAELLGSTAFVADFYQNGRLAILKAFEPLRIREAIDPVRIREHFIRYEERAVKAERRLAWFCERCGLAPEEGEVDALPPWEQPYGKTDSYRELLWGTPARKPPPRR